LQLGSQHQVAVALFLRSQRGEDFAAHTEVRRAHVGAFLSPLQAQRNPAKVSHLHFGTTLRIKSRAVPPSSPAGAPPPRRHRAWKTHCPAQSPAAWSTHPETRRASSPSVSNSAPPAPGQILSLASGLARR